MSLHPEVVAAMAEVAHRGGNPASQHALGQAARRAVDCAARALATLSGLPRGEVTFAADVAEALTLACASLAPGACVWLQGAPDLHGARGRAAQVLAAWGLRVAPAPTAWPPPADRPLPAALLLTLAAFDCDGALAPADGEALAWAAALGVPAFVDASAALAARCRASGPNRASMAAVGPLAWGPSAAPHGVAIDGAAVGGPPGVAALCVSQSPAPLRPGTVPRELAVGLGAAARRLANGG